ncbi:MAG: ParB/RepB/Spo0J family partition protein [Campylobacterota bacterium]|nr:ParB/RepB/Spo0J family partition protein [Campylobacterota bacterium]
MKNQYNKNVSYIEIDNIFPSPINVRENYSNLKDLAQSIEKVDLINPILVTPNLVDDQYTKRTYTIVSGHRRYFAIKNYLAHWDKVKCTVINDLDNLRLREIQLIENIQRDDLTDYEVTKSVVDIWNMGRYAKKQDLAISLGRSPSFVSKCINIDTNLNDSIKEDLTSNKKPIGVSILDEVARVEDHDTQKEIIQKVESGDIKRDDIRSYSQSKNKDENREPKTFPVKIQSHTLDFSGISLNQISKIYHKFLPGENYIYDTDSKYKITIEIIEDDS